MLLQSAGGVDHSWRRAIDTAHIHAQLAFVIAGNLVGGSVLVALVYWVIYRRGAARTPSG